MPEIPRTKFNSPWTVAVIEAALNDVSSAKGSSESLTAALNAMRAEINSLSGGVHLKGAVDYYSDLPANPSEGDAYTVRYQGTSGTDPLGIEYAWATYQGTPQWIPIGVDPSVFAKQTEMNVVANAGAKNLLNPDDYIKNSTGGLTITETGTGTYKITGTPSGTVDVFTTQSGTFDRMYGLEAGKTYTISGLPTGNGLLCRIDVSKNNSGSWDAQIISNLTLPQTFTVPSDATGLYIRYRVTTSATIPSGGISLEPMIRPAAITDPTFQPYAKTNPELTVLTNEDRASLIDLVDGGAKNLLKFVSLSSSYRNGVDYTLNSDGSVTVDGTPSGTAPSYASLTIDPTTAYDASEFCDGNHIISGCPSGGGSSSYRIQVAKSNYAVYDYGSGAVLTPTTLTGVAILIYIPNGVTVNNLVFRPMICTSSAWKISQAYQPYRPSWQEMFERIVALESGGNRALTMQTEPEEQEER